MVYLHKQDIIHRDLKSSNGKKILLILCVYVMNVGTAGIAYLFFLAVVLTSTMKAKVTNCN